MEPEIKEIFISAHLIESGTHPDDTLADKLRRIVRDQNTDKETNRPPKVILQKYSFDKTRMGYNVLTEITSTIANYEYL